MRKNDRYTFNAQRDDEMTMKYSFQGIICTSSLVYLVGAK